MANINLRPWREELRQKKNQEFDKGIFIVAVLAAFTWWQVNLWFSGEIEVQDRRNAMLVDGMVELDAKIKSIRALKETRKQLIERLKLIQDLQGNRPVIVRMFDEMVVKLPEDLYFTNLKLQGTNLSIQGKAKTNGRVSDLMRNFDESEWFKDPLLNGIVSSKTDYNSFTLTVSQTTPKSKENEENEG